MFAKQLVRQFISSPLRRTIHSSKFAMSTNTSGAAPDLQPGNKAPVGPSRAQPATNNQKDFVERLGASDEMPVDASKGEASDIISANLYSNGGTGGGAADDTTPGSKVPTGPSAQQPATRNQKDFVERLGASDDMPGDASKGEASDIISANLNRNGGIGGGAADDTTPGSKVPTGPSAQQSATRNQKAFVGDLGAEHQLTQETTKGEASEIIRNSLDNGDRSRGAAPDTTPGSTVPTGPSRNQPATRNQKSLLNSVGAGDKLGPNATKGEASNIISDHLAKSNASD